MIERESHVNGDAVTVIVDISGPVGHYFADHVFPEFKHPLQDYTHLSTPRTVLTAGEALLGQKRRWRRTQ